MDRHQQFFHVRYILASTCIISLEKRNLFSQALGDWSSIHLVLVWSPPLDTCLGSSHCLALAGTEQQTFNKWEITSLCMFMILARIDTGSHRWRQGCETEVLTLLMSYNRCDFYVSHLFSASSLMILQFTETVPSSYPSLMLNIFIYVLRFFSY